MLFGTTEYGGSSGAGTVFSLPVGGGSPTVLATFNGSNGYVAYPAGGLTLSGSMLYGEAANSVFSVPVSGGNPTVLASFNGSNGSFPTDGLTLSGGVLYGVSQEGGPFWIPSQYIDGYWFQRKSWLGHGFQRSCGRRGPYDAGLV